ncbi:MAG: hypothetical protein IKU91_00120 [Anaerotignum sp.]|nr:hypothetical protein [Anaerotignum sp.]
MEKDERSGFVFYKSFFEAADVLENEEQLMFLRAIITYGLFGTEPSNEDYSKNILAMFRLVRPQIDKNYERYENGKKGGRPKKEENQKETKENHPETKKNQEETKENHPEPKDKAKDKVKDKYKVKDKDKVEDSTTSGVDGGTSGCPVPPGMTEEEYQRRIEEARA